MFLLNPPCDCIGGKFHGSLRWLCLEFRCLEGSGSGKWFLRMPGFDISVVVLQNWSPELMFVDLGSVFQVGAVGTGPGPNFGRQPAKNRPHKRPKKTGEAGEEEETKTYG